MLDPHERRAPNVGLVSSRYEPDDTGRPGYGFGTWPPDPVRGFLCEDLDAGVAEKALGVDPRAFVGLLGGLCLLTRDWLGDPTRLEAAHGTSVVPFGATRLEGDGQIGAGRCYLDNVGVDLGAVDLEAARNRFLHLAGSAGKGPRPHLSCRRASGTPATPTCCTASAGPTRST